MPATALQEKLPKAKHDALIGAVWNKILLENTPMTNGKSIDFQIEFKVHWERSKAKSTEGQYSLKALVNDSDTDVTVKEHKVQFTSRDVDNYRSGQVTLDQFIADRSVSGGRQAMADAMDEVLPDIPDIDLNQAEQRWNSDASTKPKCTTYIAQKFYDENGKSKLTTDFSGLFVRAKSNVDKIPGNLMVTVPTNIVVDKQLMGRVQNYLLDGTAAAALVGPTGAGKSLHARWLAGELAEFGYASMIVDGNGRTEGDRLFERDDFNQEGTYILKGTILKFAQETAKLGLKGLCIVEEFNAFSDKTRREFYQILGDFDRVYTVQSTKNDGVNEVVDFSHIQFLITANPLTDQYVTDDLKPLSQAEQRRITTCYLDYPEDPKQIRAILETIVKGKPNFSRVNLAVKPNYSFGTKIFKEVHKPDAHGMTLGFDAGYTPIANAVWWAAVHGNTPEAWISALNDYLFTKITDIGIRETIADRIQSKLSIKIPARIVKQGV